MLYLKKILIALIATISIAPITYYISKEAQALYSNNYSHDYLKEALYKNLKLYNEQFTLQIEGSTEQIDQKLEYIMDELEKENVYLYENIAEWRAKYIYTNKNTTIHFSVQYLTTLTKEQFVKQEVKRLAKELVNDQMSDFEKVKAIHDYVVLNTEYSEETASSQYSPYTILTEKKGVCQAYALLIYQLLKELQIDVQYVKGYAGDNLHGWNLVKLNDEWYHLDATWNDPIPNRKDQVGYKYFLQPDQQMKLTHSWNEEEYPAALSSYYNQKQVASILNSEELSN